MHADPFARGSYSHVPVDALTGSGCAYTRVGDLSRPEWPAQDKAEAAKAWEAAWVDWEGDEESSVNRGENGQPIQLGPAMRRLLGSPAEETELPLPELYSRAGLGCRLWFAGEACSYDRAQCVDGAVEIGQLAALCVAADMASPKTKTKRRAVSPAPRQSVRCGRILPPPLSCDVLLVKHEVGGTG